MFNFTTLWRNNVSVRDNNEESVASSATKTSRRSRASPYPARLTPADNHPLGNSRGTVRSKVRNSNWSSTTP